jgi:phenylalanyl-tRNA synthetase beta chain
MGKEISPQEITGILDKLGFKIDKSGEDQTLKVTIPTWRATKDISGREDIMEEVSRIYGYNNLPPKMPLVEMVTPSLNKERVLERKIKELLAYGCAMTETYNYSFTNEEKLGKLKIDPSGYIRLSNPISGQHTLLRQSMTTNLLDNIKQNQANYDHIKMFEFGSVYLNFSGEINKDSSGKEKLPYQEKRLGLVEASSQEDVFDRLKGRLRYICESLDLEIDFEPSDIPHPWSDTNLFAKVVIDGEGIGFVSGVDDKILKSLGIKKRVAVAEINFREIFARSEGGIKSFESLNRYPSLRRDLAFVVDVKVLYSDIKNEIENFSDLVKEVELFDVYQGEKLGKKEKSLAFHITYRSEERTLQAKEVDELQQELFEKLKEKFEARVRDF